MRLKNLYDYTVDVPGVGLVEPGEIIDVDRTMGRSLASSGMWRVTSRDKDDVEEEDDGDTAEEETE